MYNVFEALLIRALKAFSYFEKGLINLKKEKAKRIAKRITALAAAVAMAATFTFPAEIGEGYFSFGNAIVASAAAIQHNVADGDVNITAEGDYEITGTSSTSKIIVDCSGTVHIKLDTVTITASYNGNVLDIRNGIVNLELDGNSILQARQNIAKSDDKNAVYMSDSAELHIYDADNNGSIKIRGTSHYYGGGAAVRGGSMYIHSGNVSLNGGSMIMGGYGNSFIGKNFDVSGGSVSIAAGELDETKNGSITVSDSFKVGSGVSLTVPTNGTIEIGTGASATVEGTVVNNGTITNNGTLTNNGSIINFGSGSVTGTVSGNQPDTKGTAFTITGSGLVYGTDYTYPASTGVLTIKSDKAVTIANANTGSTTDRIEVADGISANITLDNVNIDVSGTGRASAFKIADDSTGNVTITLEDGSENTLKSGNECAGLQKNGTSGSLEIKGTGKLTATGGPSGAGIGGGLWRSACPITISGGIVNANAGENAAGIGGGAHASGANITIDGGTVTAIGDKGAGVGGGMSGDFGSNITINGGTVTATSTDGAGIGGGLDGNSSNILITGGSVKAISTNANYIGGGLNKDAVTPTLSDSTTSVYPLTIENPTGADVFIDGSTTPYNPSNHSVAGTGDTKLYTYLTGETHKVKIGDEETKYNFYTDKFLSVPKASDFTFTAPSDLAYDGNAKTATVTAKTGMGEITVKYYDAAGSKLDSAPVVPGTYTVKIDVEAGTYYDAVNDLTADDWKFTIAQAVPTVTEPTATAITYGEALSASTLSDTNWSWVDKTVIPTVQNSGYPAKITVDDSNYDYTNIDGYDNAAHTVTRTIAVTVNPATPTITVTANPTTAITGKETTVTVTAEAKNPNNETLTDVPTPELSYKIGNGSEQAITGGAFVIPANTPNGTVVTITATTNQTAQYNAKTDTKTITVADCTHANVSSTVWATDDTYHWHECPDCGAELGKAEHSSNAPATETTDEVCKDCGKVMSTATGHIHKNHLTFVDRVEPADCTTDGVKAHYECDCGKLFADAQAATEVTLASLKIPAHHSYGTEWVSDNDDNHYHVCSGCDEKLDFAAHTYGKWKITVPATAEANGKKERICSVCGYVQEGIVTYGGDESTGDMENATNPDTNACHADLELTDEEIIEKIPLTPEELEAIENGANLEVYMVVIDYSGNVPAEEKALAEAVLTGDMQIGMYIDVSLFVKVGDNNPRAVTETNGDLKITFEMPEKLINTDKNVTREYSIVRVHDGNVTVLDCAYNSATGKGSFNTYQFSTYAIAYKDIAEEEPAPEPTPVVRYPIIVRGNVSVDKTSATADETVNVRTDLGYDIIVTAENGQRIAKITEKGSFTMPASKVYVTAVRNETFALMANAWRQSYVYSYDAEMNKIKVSSTKKRGVIVINLGEEYAGRTFTIYSGRKSTEVKVTEGVLDENGKFVFEVPDGKNYTLVVEE